METGWLFVRISMLDAAVAQASRFIYTGAAQYGAVSHDQLEDYICEKSIVLNKSDCLDNIEVEMTVIDSFDAAPTSDPVCRSTDFAVNPVASYDPGGASEVVFLRVCILTELFTPALALGARLSKAENDRYRMISTTAFMNEPF